MKRALIAIAPLVALIACSIEDVKTIGKQCPCASDTRCNVALDVCVPLAQDSCIAQPLTHPFYSTRDFTSYPADFDTTSTGVWTLGSNNIMQSSTTQVAAITLKASFVLPTQDYRVVATVTSTTGAAADGSVEVAGRTDTSAFGYHCNLLPNANSLSETRGGSDFGSAQGLDELSVGTPQVLELQVIGNTLECCIRDVPRASLSATDPQVDAMGPITGQPGVKTFKSPGTFTDFEVWN